MNILGISAFYHESTCCLLADGRVVAAASEERFSRRKHDPRLPVAAFRFCLDAAGLGPTDLDAVAYYERPEAKLTRQLWALSPREGDGRPAGREDPARLDPGRPERLIRERLGWDGPFLTFDHHLAHAASAFFFSGLPEAAVLTVDGVGEWATTSYGRGTADRLELFEEVRFPHSLGLLYSTLTAYLGFRVNGGEGKVMGLAAYGRPRYVEQVRRLIASRPGGGYLLDLAYFDFLHGRRMDSPALWDLLGGPPRAPETTIEPRHMDVACSLQQVLEEVLLEKVRYLHERTGLDALCLAGGVALNSRANGRIAREGPFHKVWVQPAAGDAGAALGAAALAHRELAGGDAARRAVAPLEHVFLGPAWSAESVASLVAGSGLPALDFRGRERELLEAATERLAAGRVVGWFQGPMELGPRALGGRSILASPLRSELRDRLNLRIKRREGFRPFAPSVLAHRAGEHFDLDHPSPFMLETCRVVSPLELPAVTHVDGSARIQTVDPATAPRFAALLESFERRTGCPVLLNTSFNVRGEPIVCSPADALFTLADAGLDSLVMEDTLLDREALPAGWRARLAAWRPAPPARPPERPEPSLEGNLYTFV